MESRPEKSSVGAQAHFIQALEAARPPYLECLEDYAKYAKDLVWTIRQGPEISLDQFIGEVLESHPQAGQTKEGG